MPAILDFVDSRFVDSDTNSMIRGSYFLLILLSLNNTRNSNNEMPYKDQKQKMLDDAHQLKSRIGALIEPSVSLRDKVQLMPDELEDVERLVQEQKDDLARSRAFEERLKSLFPKLYTKPFEPDQLADELIMEEKTLRQVLFMKVSREPGLRHLLLLGIYEVLNGDMDESTMYSLVSRLKPLFTDLYPDGISPAHEEWLSALSQEEYLIICDFLGFLFTYAELFSAREKFSEHTEIAQKGMSENYFLRQQAAMALKWGWNRYNNAPYQQAISYYQRHTSYTWDFNQLGEAGEVCSNIKECFSATRKPLSVEELIRNPGPDDEIAQYGMEFQGLDWWQLHPDFLNQYYSCLSFFTKAGLRYYLPAYLILDLAGKDHHDSAFNAVTLWKEVDTTWREKLGLADWRQSIQLPDCSDWHFDRMKSFTDPERRGIAAYLRYKIKITEDDGDREDAKASLEAFWTDFKDK